MSRVPVKAPKGWRLLRKGTTIKVGDKFLCHGTWERSFNWRFNSRSGDAISYFPYARRITRKRKGAK